MELVQSTTRKLNESVESEALRLSADRYEMLSSFVNQHMTPKVDYGIVPGTNDKATLFKPGAEKLCRLFRLNCNISLVYSVEDFSGELHNGEPLFYYRYKCELNHQGQLVATCEGSCNSWEKKYRYREQKPRCPKCEETAIRRGQSEFYCWAKIGGCGAKFPLTFEAIASQKTGVTVNTEIFDQINTIQKMAQKRALVGAVLVATAASEFFSQDLEQ